MVAEQNIENSLESAYKDSLEYAYKHFLQHSVVIISTFSINSLRAPA